MAHVVGHCRAASHIFIPMMGSDARCSVVRYCRSCALSVSSFVCACEHMPHVCICVCLCVLVCVRLRAKRWLWVWQRTTLRPHSSLIQLCWPWCHEWTRCVHAWLSACVCVCMNCFAGVLLFPRLYIHQVIIGTHTVLADGGWAKWLATGVIVILCWANILFSPLLCCQCGSGLHMRTQLQKWWLSSSSLPLPPSLPPHSLKALNGAHAISLAAAHHSVPVRTYTHTHTQTHLYTHTHTDTLIHMHTYKHTHMHTYKHTHMHTRSHRLTLYLIACMPDMWWSITT